MVPLLVMVPFGEQSLFTVTVAPSPTVTVVPELTFSVPMVTLTPSAISRAALLDRLIVPMVPLAQILKILLFCTLMVPPLPVKEVMHLVLFPE